MQTYISSKNFTPDKQFEKIYKRYVVKFEKKLHNFADDLPVIALHIKRHEKHQYYTARLALTLPKKTLISTTKGHTSEEILHGLFEKIIREFEAYKGKHFKGSSKHPKREKVVKRIAIDTVVQSQGYESHSMI